MVAGRVFSDGRKPSSAVLTAVVLTDRNCSRENGFAFAPAAFRVTDIAAAVLGKGFGPCKPIRLLVWGRLSSLPVRATFQSPRSLYSHSYSYSYSYSHPLSPNHRVRV